MYDWCRTYKYDIERFDLATFIDQSKANETEPNSVGWYLYEDKKDFSKQTELLRHELGLMFDSEIRYMGVWDYYPGFVDSLGPHIDRGDIENAVVFMCPRGELIVTLHDPETKQVLETKKLSGNNIMVLYHTKFMHHIEGVGDLVVFGLPQDFDAEMFFRADGKYYKRHTIDYDVDKLLDEVMELYPSDPDKITTFNYFPMSEGHTEYTFTFDPLPDHMRDAIERTTGEKLVPGITYLSDFRNTATSLDIHKDPRWNALGPIPPLLSMVCLDGYTRFYVWTGRNGTKLLDMCLYGPGDVITFDHTEVFHSADSVLKDRRKRNMQCYSYGNETVPFVVQYNDWYKKYRPWVEQFVEENNITDSIDWEQPIFTAYDNYVLASISIIDIEGDIGYVRTYDAHKDNTFEIAMRPHVIDWAEDNGLKPMVKREHDGTVVDYAL